jgi:hypothetical protein
MFINMLAKSDPDLNIMWRGIETLKFSAQLLVTFTANDMMTNASERRRGITRRFRPKSIVVTKPSSAMKTNWTKVTMFPDWGFRFINNSRTTTFAQQQIITAIIVDSAIVRSTRRDQRFYEERRSAVPVGETGKTKRGDLRG